MKINARRRPIGFAAPPKRYRRKWEAIVSAFLAGDLERLRTLQRGGARGRILATLARQCFDLLRIPYESEPVFEPVPPADWYVEFAAQHGLKLVVDDRYNPDFLFGDGSWGEVTLSENTAYKKLFRYAHQAPSLLVLWLDPDDGLHKRVCEGVAFPNAQPRSLEEYYPQLHKAADGPALVAKLEALKKLKGDIL